MNPIVILIYWAVAGVIVWLANQFWLAKSLPRMQDIRVQFCLFLVWGLLFSAKNFIGWVAIIAALCYKFWVDFRLWHRAKTGAMYPCIVDKIDDELRGRILTHLTIIPVVIVQTLNDKKPEEKQTYWCRVLKYSVLSTRVEVELLEKMDWGESSQYFASKKRRSKKLNLASFFKFLKN